jgi:hypothetical protein
MDDRQAVTPEEFASLHEAKLKALAAAVEDDGDWDDMAPVPPATPQGRYETVYATAPACSKCGCWDELVTYGTNRYDGGRIRYTNCPCGHRFKINWIAPSTD